MKTKLFHCLNFLFFSLALCSCASTNMKIDKGQETEVKQNKQAASEMIRQRQRITRRFHERL